MTDVTIPVHRIVRQKEKKTRVFFNRNTTYVEHEMCDHTGKNFEAIPGKH
jgi:hypothetical protein